MDQVKIIPPSPAEVEKALGSREVHAAITARAEAGKSYAQSIAPTDTGAFRESFAVEASGGSGKAEARIVNTDPGAAAIEFGSEDTPAHNVLSRTADYLESEAR